MAGDHPVPCGCQPLGSKEGKI
ncbi:uncharacterized protein G2W53_027631 [Senna tora]|uniref:Uncharacterized protein n=1 Tax=Senna tora TaxID=362788 RepID=A0A834TJV1_9FABA|nr:uncharacterized protein G2W53_027631 [Senna tora]